MKHGSEVMNTKLSSSYCNGYLLPHQDKKKIMPNVQQMKVIHIFSKIKRVLCITNIPHKVKLLTITSYLQVFRQPTDAESNCSLNPCVVFLLAADSNQK
jgi:hypothetical protein